MTSWRSSVLRPALGVLLVTTLSLVCLEAGARVFFWFKSSLPLGHPDRALYVYYPELAESDEGYPSRDGQSFDVLLLGESVLHPEWGEVAQAPKEALAFSLAPYHDTARFALPYTVRYISTGLRAALRPDRYVPTNSPIAEWEQYAAQPRSPESLRQNLENIVRIAHERDDPLMLMTFATYVPANYSKLAFRSHSLDYGTHLSALEIWGAPQYVRLAIDRQNDVIRAIASRHHDVMFVDQARLMTGSNRYFNDPCHLTVAGSALFAQHIVDAFDAARSAGAAANSTGGD